MTEVLPSWADGTARRTILDFVSRVSAPGGPDLLPEAERIAVFENDGTLWRITLVSMKSDWKTAFGG